MNIDYTAIHAHARRLRTDAMNRYLFAPIAAFFRRLTGAQPRRAPAVFHSVRGC